MTSLSIAFRARVEAYTVSRANFDCIRPAIRAPDTVAVTKRQDRRRQQALQML